MKKLLSITLLFSITACSIFGGKAAEEPKFSIIEQEEQFEVREYESFVIAETFVNAEYEESTSEAFGRLFDYITGDNLGEKDIKMTAPVLQEKPAKGWKMAFVLPEDFAIENAPRPSNNDVMLVKVDEKKLAVVTYSGSLAEDNIIKNLDKLRGWLDGKGFTDQPSGIR